MHKQGAGELPDSKVGTNHRTTQCLQEDLAEHMPLWDDQLQSSFLIDLCSQQGNRELVDNEKCRVIRPFQVDKLCISGSSALN